jgi:hypothetical protein
MRLTGLLAASLGLAFIAWRFRWPGLVTGLVLLTIPHVRDDLARAWAEGPLMLGLGLCAMAFGNRWFGLTLGLAASFKLTALALWPLTFHPHANGQWTARRGLLAAALTFAATNPQGWSLGVILHFGALIYFRFAQAFDVFEVLGGPRGLPLPSRYFWPFELAAILALSLLLAHLLARYRQRPLRRPLALP